MQQLDYSLINRKLIVRTTNGYPQERKSCFLDENRHNRLFADNDINEYINAQIKKVSEKLDNKIRNS